MKNYSNKEIELSIVINERKKKNKLIQIKIFFPLFSTYECQRHVTLDDYLVRTRKPSLRRYQLR